MKIYKEQNVYNASIDRIRYIFAEFDNVYLSLSGGKDSSVMMQIVNHVARELNRTYDVFLLDLEAQYEATMNHVEDLKKLSNIGDFYHICLPLNLTNSSSILQPHWTCWNPDKKDLWVREMPKGVININNNPFGEYYSEGEEFETFMRKFPQFLMEKHGTSKVAGMVGIRTDESFNRFRAIAFGKNLYKDKVWSTDNNKGYYSFYPIYDWKTQDIWHCVSKFNLLYNEVYEMLYKNGVGIHDQRICHPYGKDQRVSLNQWAALEPDTWARVVNRVSGANFGNIYCKTTLLGHNGTQKPDHMTWQEYAVFLLETINMYSPTLTRHYIRKVKIYFKYYKDNYNIDVADIPDFTPPKIAKQHGKGIHWKRIAKCIEKNDFICASLSYGTTKADIEDAKALKKEWGDRLGMQTGTKAMRELQAKI